MRIHKNLNIPATPGPRVPNTILISIFWDLVAWICYLSLTMQGNLYIPKMPGPPGPPNNVKYYTLGLCGLDYHLVEMDLFTIKNAMTNVYPKATGTSGPPSHINYDILGLGGLDKGFAYPKGPGTPGPQTTLVTTFCDVGSGLSCWRIESVCL